MDKAFKNHELTYHLKPGEVFVTKKDVVISTILGSCVSVCLWDENLKIGGMNHIVFPIHRKGDFNSTRFADTGTFVLYDIFKKEVKSKSEVSARIFGGAFGISSNNNKSNVNNIGIGPRNIEVVKNILNKLNIPVISSDLGGHFGRKVFFNVNTGKIKMYYIQNYNFKQEI